MKFGKSAGGARGEQTLEETQKWTRLANRFNKNGGPGVEMDFRCTVVGIKHPHEIKMTVNGKQTLINYGEETPEEDRFKVNDKGKTVPMQPGCLITVECAEERFAGLRFYKTGTYSGNDKTPVYKLGNAIYRGKLDDVEVDPDQDFIGKEVLVTIAMGNAHENTAVDGNPLKGGFWWNVKGFKAIPMADDDDDDDFPTAATPAVANRNTVATSSAVAAPAATAAGTRTEARPSTKLATSVAVLDDDDDVPFD